jgi:hypothetical protein
VRVSTEMDGTTLVFSFAMEEGEPKPAGNVTMVRDRAHVELPPGWSLDDLHPDLLALACLLLCQPFGGEVLEVPRPVSPPFAAAARKGMARTVTPVDPAQPPRRVEGVPALNFSGGVDSFAALAVLPAETELFFLERLVPEDAAQPSRYAGAAAHHACDVLEREHGRRVWRIKTDLEYLRSPIGFPLHVTNAVPAVLMADQLGLDAMAWGSVSESAYNLGSSRFVEYAERRDYRRLGAVFAAAGLPYLQAVAGVSEVGTTEIVRRSPYAGLAQSCVQGEVGRPCFGCKKCFRKALLERVLAGTPIEDELVDTLASSGQVRAYLATVPIKHENVIAFIMARYDGKHPVLKALKTCVHRPGRSMAWLERWYTPSLELVPERYRSAVEEGLNRYLQPTTRAQEETIRHWDLERASNSLRRRRRRQRLVAALERYAPPKPKRKEAKAPAAGPPAG